LTIQKEYVEKRDVEGFLRAFDLLTLKNGQIKLQEKSEKAAFEKGKLLPTDLGSLVNKFLMQYFENIIDYQFTATVEKDFDEIASGQKVWNEMIGKFYVSFHRQIKRLIRQASLANVFWELTPNQVKTWRETIVWPGSQIGETESEENQRFAGLRDYQLTITLEQV
jgi:DNA topoisomerase-1